MRVLHRPSESASHDQSGLSLIELMIGMTLGLLILGAVLYVFAGNRASYRHQESLSVVQENGRFGIDLMAWDLRYAGNAGCGRGGSLFDANDPTITVEFPAILQANANSLTLSYGFVPGGLNRLVGLDKSSNEIELDSLAGIALGNIIMLSNCILFQRVEVVAIDAVANAVTVNQPGLPVGSPLVAGLLDPWRDDAGFLPFFIREGRTVVYDFVGGELRRNGDAIADSVIGLQFGYGVDDVSLPKQRANTEHICQQVPDAADVRCSDRNEIVSINVVLTVADGPINVPFVTNVALRNRISVE